MSNKICNKELYNYHLNKLNNIMAREFFNYTKTILKKVSFDAGLFQIELSKALKRLLPYEVYELSKWMQDYFKDKPKLQPCIMQVKQLENK